MAHMINGREHATDAAVLAAFAAARSEGHSSVECYVAGVKAERFLHPEYHPAYAAKMAVRTMIKSAFGDHVAAILDRHNA
jgi:hypothetical protein